MMRRKEEEHMIDWVEKHVVKSISAQQVHDDLLYLLWLDQYSSIHVLFSMCVCTYIMQVPMKARSFILWSWSYRQQ